MNFYVLKNPSSYDNHKYAILDYDHVGTINRGDAKQCPKCGSTLSSLAWLPPYRVILEPWSNRYGDIGFAGDELLLSENFMERFRQAGLRGLEVLGKAEIVKVKRRGGARPKGDPPSYFVAVPTRSFTKIDLKASGAETERPASCDTCLSHGLLYRYARIVIDEATWSGDDIFYAMGISGPIIVSQRYATWHHENQINTGDLIRSEDYKVDYYPAE